MNTPPDYVTAINSDWTPENMGVLRETLSQAYFATDERTNPDRDLIYATPNRYLARGYLRWMAVDAYLERACVIGAFKGITAHWVKLTDGDGGIMALELRGAYTTVMAHHLLSLDTPARNSRLRFDRRAKNQRNPALPNFVLRDEEMEQPADPLLNITLVHGDKKAEFAYFRIYDDEDDLNSYISASTNIMGAPIIVTPVEDEDVKDPDVELRRDIDIPNTDDNKEADGS